MTGAFTVYRSSSPSSVAPRAGGARALSALLLAYGLAALAGNAGGCGADRWGARPSIAVALSSLIVSVSALAYAVGLGPPSGRSIAISAMITWAEG